MPAANTRSKKRPKDPESDIEANAVQDEIDEHDPLTLLSSAHLGTAAPQPRSPVQLLEEIRALANIVNEGHESPLQDIPRAVTDLPIDATGQLGGPVEEGQFQAEVALQEGEPGLEVNRVGEEIEDEEFDPKDPHKKKIFYDREGVAGNHLTWSRALRVATEPNRLLQLDPYCSWSKDCNGLPISPDEITAIFQKLANTFGFQKSSMENMLDHFMTQLDSRASRMDPNRALISLHASYIGGDNSNYKKWYFAAQLDLDEEVGFSSMKLHGKAYKRNKKVAREHNLDIKAKRRTAKEQDSSYLANVVNVTTDETEGDSEHTVAEHKWRTKMLNLTPQEYVEEVALYLLIWGEANQARFLPEFLCFIFKCAIDYYRSEECLRATEVTPEYEFLNKIITPVYQFLRNQIYKVDGNSLMRKRTRDHKDIIGYDDVNQLFWYPEGIERIKFKSTKKRMVDYLPEKRYKMLFDLDWGNVFYKTFKETRTWTHTITNFNRIWIIHFASYWFFTSFNSPTLYTKDYQQLLDNPPTPQVRLTIIALGGFLCCLIQLFATFAEWSVVPSKWPGRPHLFKRFVGLSALTLINVLPSIFIFSVFDLETHSRTAHWIAVVQLNIAIATCIYFSYQPLARLFTYGKPNGKKRRYVSSQTFTASFARLTGRSYWFSVILWFVVFVAKYLESYFFLTLSIRDPIRVLSITEMTRCVGDTYIGNLLCRHQSHIVLGLVYLTELVLFFLDTYLWYIVCNCFFSMGLSFSLGMSILTPWRNVFARLPKRIYSKILATTEMEIKYKPKILVSQVWNAVIISMYREHLLPVELVHKLLYHQAASEIGSTYKSTLKSPSFFIAHDDSTFKSIEFFPRNSEAERRVSFFAQSLSTPIPEPNGVETMPTFTVLIPHYGEKILLTLSETLKETNENARISLLEYLKKLYPTEWQCFVNDTKLMALHHGYGRTGAVKYDTTKKKRNLPDIEDEPQADGEVLLPRPEDPRLPLTVASPSMNSAEYPKSPETEMFENEVVDYLSKKKGLKRWSKPKRQAPTTPLPIPEGPLLEENLEISMDGEGFEGSNDFNTVDDMPFYCVGFKRAVPEFQLRTRIWASLRSQTLYRTASGFLNYTKALKLLYRVENPDMVHYYSDDVDGLEEELDAMAARKFKLVIAMQRLTHFSESQKLDYLFLLKAFPEIRIAYLQEETNPDDPSGEKLFYSCITDGYSEFDDNGDRIPKCRVRLSGNPILGDGKSDNQNHLLIFYRGEYIQVVDANQDNYLEECIKIRSVLAEFEEMNPPTESPYRTDNIISKDVEAAPVAIVGAREYIFSENIGVLGDVAAGKEQTFGTLFARTLAEIGGKLHYGHPDFLNAIFMTTRGGISKAQRGLHLNEDIYAGMNAMLRGGRIKHCDYYQCGKGRDLGFGSILNFTTKIGAGMGEQLLSREYYYLGTQLPLDRFLSFYYAHPGFHINNLFITLSVQMFMMVLVNLGALRHESILCKYNKDVPYTDLQEPIGCYMIQPVLNWVTIFIFSVFLVFFIAFVPLIIQELTERGLWKAMSRFSHHLASLSPFFEVFVCQIYSNALMTDVTFGGAKYISSGRGFAIQRVPFYDLYSRFTTSSIYSGARLFLMILFSSLTIWQPALLWFWISLVSMCFAPFIFNPHQFSIGDYLVDYCNFLRWLYTGNGYERGKRLESATWIYSIRTNRARYTGYCKPRPGQSRIVSDVRKPTVLDLWLSEVTVPFLTCLTSFCAYSFTNSQNGVRDVKPTNSILRLLILVLGPIAANIGVLFVVFVVTLMVTPFTLIQVKSGYVIRRGRKEALYESVSNFSGNLTAGIAHTCSVLIHLFLFEVIWYLEGWSFIRALACLICVVSSQEFLFSCLTLMLTREWRDEKINYMWWTALWLQPSEIGYRSIFFQPLREFLCKVMEMSQFSLDFIIGHMILFIQAPFVIIPFIDRCHTLVLFWLKPTQQFRRRYFHTRLRSKRTRIIVISIVTYLLMVGVFVVSFLVPVLTASHIPDFSSTLNNTIFDGLLQPNGQWNDDTGANATSIITTKGVMPEFKTHPW